MGFKKVKSKNAILSMILCSAASFSLLHADNLKECESEEDKKAGCIEKVYDENGNLNTQANKRSKKPYSSLFNAKYSNSSIKS